MKKILALTLALAMILCMAACGTPAPAETTDPKAEETTAPKAQETTAPKTEETDPAPVETTAPVADVPSEKEVLFAWEGYADMVFYADGTFDFNYKDMVKETGTWKWVDWDLIVTNTNGDEAVGKVDKEDNNLLKFTYTAAANSQLVVNYKVEATVWGAALGISGTYEPVGGESEPSVGGVARFAGEYDLYSEAKDMYCEEFVIDEDGTVHGVVESSGLTAFTGTVSEDGTITAEVTRLGGTMTGTITEDLQVSIHFVVRGSETDFVGGPLE